MQYLKKYIKYEIVKRKIIKSNSIKLCRSSCDKPTIYLFFVACGRNMGDHAIVKSEINFIRKVLGQDINIIEITTSQTESALLKLKKVIRSQDIIILSGGGYLGDEYIELYRPLLRLLKIYSKNKIIVFPQTIFFHNKRREELFMKKCKKCDRLAIFLREKISDDIFESYGIRCFLTPDIVLSNDIKKHFDNEQILVCLRQDVERGLSVEDNKKIVKVAQKYGEVCITDTVEEEIFKQNDRFIYLNKLVDQFLKSKLIITDRIHGMIFAYLTNTPCIVFGNYNHKVEAEYEWLKDSLKMQFLADMDEENLMRTIDAVLKEQEYSNFSMKDKYYELEDILKKYYE